MAQHIVGRGQISVTEVIDGYTIIVSPDSITVPCSPTGVVSAADLNAIPDVSVKVYKGDVLLTAGSTAKGRYAITVLGITAGLGISVGFDYYKITSIADSLSTAKFTARLNIEGTTTIDKVVTISKAYKGDTGPIAQYWGLWSATTQYYNDPNVQYIVKYNDHWYATLIKNPRSPIPLGTLPTNTTYWMAAQESKFIATNLLLADDAYIGQLNSPKVYIGDNGTNGWVIDSGSISSIAQTSGAPTTQLTSDGKLIANSATIRGNITAESLTVTSGDASTILNQAGGATVKNVANFDTNSINTNPYFLDWPTNSTYPADWFYDPNGTITRAPDANGKGDNLLMTVTAGTNTYISSNIFGECPYYEYLTVEVTFKVTQGILDGSGVGLNISNLGIIPISFKEHITSYNINKWYTLKVTVPNIKPTTTAFGGTYNFYLMGGWTGFTGENITTKSIIFRSFTCRAASEQEINAYNTGNTVDSWRSPNTTTINGGMITTSSITASQLNFTPVASTNVIASINASTEGGGTLKIAGKHIQIDGNVVFSSGYDPTTKATPADVTTAKNSAISTAASDATTKASNAQSAAISAAASDATTKANNALAAAKTDASTKVTALQNQLGDLAYEDLVETAKLGSTIIQGGYIKTGLVNASNITTGTLAAARIASGSITADKIDTAGFLSQTSVVSAINAPLDNLKVGGQNLIDDSHFYFGTNSLPIGTANYGTTEIDSNGRFKATFDNAGAASRLEFTKVLSPGDYVISLSTQASRSYHTSGWVGVSSFEAKTVPYSANFQVNSFTFTVATAGTVTFRFYLENPVTNDTFYVEWLKLEEGNKPTAWSPSYGDQQLLLDNLQIGGTNILLKTTELPKAFNASTTFTVNTDGSITMTQAASSPAGGPVWYLSSPSKAGTYTLSFEYKTTDWTNFGQLYLLYRDGTQNYTPLTLGTVNKDGVWHKVSQTFSYTDLYEGYAAFMPFYNNPPSGSTITFKNMKLEEGEKATSWSPAPEDNYNSNIILGGTNLVQNSDFSQGKTNWANNGGGGALDTTTFPGINTIRMESSTSGSGVYATGPSLAPTTIGEEYTFSYDIYFSTTATMPQTTAVGIENPSVRLTDLTGITAGKWIRISNTFTATQTLTRFVTYTGTPASGTISRYWITNIKIEKGNKATAWTPSLEDQFANTGSLGIRYIRDYIQNSSSGITNIWCEIQAISVGGNNRALGCPVSDSSAPVSNALDVTDGYTGTAHYASIATSGLQYVTIDLGRVYYDIDHIKVYHYFTDGRTYLNTKTQVSTDNSTWYNVFNSALSGTYVETSDGNNIPISTGALNTTTTATISNINGQIALKADSSTVNALGQRVSDNEASLTVQAGQISTKVSQTDYDNKISSLAADDSFGIGTQTLSTIGWYRIASNSGDRALGKFIITNTNSGNHGTCSFYAGTAYSKTSFQLVAYNKYTAENWVSKARLVKKSTYDPVYLEIYISQPTNVAVWCTENVNGSRWVKVGLTAGEIPTGYSADEYPIDSNHVAATAADLSSVQTTLQTSIDQNAHDITLKATQTDVTSLTGRVTTAEGKITTNANNITSAVSRISGVEGRMTSAESSILQNADDITLEVSKREDLAASVGNLVNNPAASGNVSGWSAGESTYTTSTMSGAFSGKPIGVLSNTTTGSAQIISDYFPVDTSKAYQVTVTMKLGTAYDRGTATNIPTYYFGLYGFNSSKSQVTHGRVYDNNGTDGGDNNNFYFVSAGLNTLDQGSWKRLTGYILPAGFDYSKAIGIGENVSLHAVLTPDVSYMRVRLYNYYNSADHPNTVFFTQMKVVEVDSNSLAQISTAQASIKLNTDNIELKVDKNGVISSINQSAEAVSISASKINLNGAVTISSLDDATRGVLANSDASLINPNPYFLDWVGTSPVGYGTFTGNTGASQAKVSSSNGLGNALQYTTTSATTTCYFSPALVSNLPFYQYVTITATVMLHSGTLAGSGILFRRVATSNVDERIAFTNIIPSPILDKWYTISFTSYCATEPAGFSGYQVYPMAQWATFSTGSGAKVLQFDSLIARPATQQEINAYQTGNTVGSWTYPNKTTINGGKIETNTITATQIAANTITASQIAASTITGGRIAANTITATNIAANTITANEINTSSIQAAVVTAAKVNALDLSASSITTGTLASARIAANTITVAQLNFTPVQAGGAAADINGHTTTITGSKITTNSIDANRIITSTLTALGAVTAGSFNIGSGKFQVTSAGVLSATGATISGAITATSGSFTGTIHASAGDIGGWDINSAGLYNDTVKAGIIGGAGNVLYIGSTYANRNSTALATRPKFTLDDDGTITINNTDNVNGKLVLKSGTNSQDGNTSCFQFYSGNVTSGQNTGTVIPDISISEIQGFDTTSSGSYSIGQMTFWGQYIASNRDVTYVSGNGVFSNSSNYGFQPATTGTESNASIVGLLRRGNSSSTGIGAAVVGIDQTASYSGSGSQNFGGYFNTAFAGGLCGGVRRITSTGTTTLTEEDFLITLGANVVTINLPAHPKTGQFYMIKNDGGTGTLSGNGKTIVARNAPQSTLDLNASGNIYMMTWVWYDGYYWQSMRTDFS